MTQPILNLIGPAAPTASELSEIAQVIYEHAGIVIAPGKTSMVQSRLGKRLRALGLKDYRSYLALIASEDGGEERREMISALTTNVTQFFRENHHFETLRNTALPPLLAQARTGQRIRIWSAGCSNGQEAFSIAMLLADLEPDFATLDIRILATDIDPQMISRGREGLYEASVLGSIPKPLHRFLVQEANSVRINDPIRSMVTFRELNLHKPWPMKGLFDIIFCRNVVIYFDPESQLRLWRRFESVLASGGWLFVGHSERVPLDAPSQFVTAGITSYRLPPTAAPIGASRWH